MQPHPRRNQSALWLSANNWHSISPERRALKRYRLTPASHLNHPDVYPQDPNQEEDKMDIERLKRGYHAVPPLMEYDSIIRNPRLGNQDEVSRTAKWMIQIMQKKNEINIINLDRKRLKECTFHKFDASTTPKSIQDFFISFTTGRRELHQLARRFPIFVNKEDCMHTIYIYKVPIQRALWFFKMMQFGLHNGGGLQNKQKRSSVDLYTSDQTKLFSKFIREFFRICDTSPQSEMHQRWPYFACILKHAFEDGIVDKQDLLMDICDVASDYMTFSFEKPQIFRMLIIFLSQFVDVITQNAMLSRRVAYLVATRFKIYKRNYDRKRRASSANVYSSECFADLVNCQHHRAIMMAMLGLMHAIIIDCPVALIWNPFENSNRMGGSPLDLLPCSSEVLGQHLPASCARINELLQLHLSEIKERSQNVERRWMRETKPHSGFDFIVDVCLNVISALDKVVLDSPNTFHRLYQQIFCSELGEKVTPQLIVRILIQWVVTTEREGTHRALVVCKLLQMRKRHYRSMAFGTCSLQDIFMEYLNSESPTPATSAANFQEEFRNLIHLFVELQHFQLFSHDVYIRALMRCGQFTYQTPIIQKIINYTKSSQQPAAPDNSTGTFKSTPVTNGQGIHDSSVSGKPLGGGQDSLSDSFGASSTLTLTSMRPETSIAPDPAIISFIPTSSNNMTNASAGLPSTVTASASNFLESANFSTAPTTSTSSLAGLPGLHTSLSSSSLLGGAADSSARSTPGRATPLIANNGSKDATKQTIIEHIFITSPPEMTVHERFFMHLPIEQTDECRDACNQRAILLYGISGERDLAQQELQKISSQICRIWQKKINVEFFENSKEVRFKRRFSPDQIAECLSKFRTQTYYDQLVITGFCVRNLLEMLSDFLNCCSLLLPTSESVEVICFMLITCQNYRGIMTLAVEILPQLILLESFLSSFHNDCIPGTISCQMAYVIVGYLAENFFYFLHSAEAPAIVNGLYRLIEKELCADSYPVSGWARAIAMFVFHAKNGLLNADVCSSDYLLGTLEVFRRIFPKSGADKSPQELKHNPRLFMDFLQEPRRFYSYHDYKKRLPSIEDPHTQYSFVVNAFIVARSAKKDYSKLVELSNICGHVSAEKPLSGMWCVAIQELCYGNITKHGFSHLINEVNVNDSVTRYSISTFVFLLASKYCFSCHALFIRLLNNVLLPFIKTEQVNFNGSEMGLCLALEIIASIVCATDIPFTYNESETSGRFSTGTLSDAIDGLPTEQANSGFAVGAKSPLQKTSDERMLRVVQIRELDKSIFQMLSAICILTDAVKRKLNASSGANLNLRHLLDVLKCTFLAMCEQEWVIERVFRICETADMDAFNCNALKHNSVGQQLLRIALRRKCERTTKQQLMVCNGNSKKSLLDKLLSAMTLWNMRATYYDLKLMIKEVSPDGTQKHAPQQQAYMDALICEIGKCCRDLFLNCQVEDYNFTKRSRSIGAFRFNELNCYWLISPLINVCPKPDNIPQSFSGQVTVKAKFLKEAAAMLDTSSDNSMERLRQSARLLSQEPFLNLILTCTQGEELDNLIGSLLRHIQVIINKAKENPTLVHQSTFMLEREGLLLRLNLIGGIFDSLLVSTSTSEPWAIAFFQLIFYEIISYEREREYFNICYDMLATLVYSMMATSTSSTQGDSERRLESRMRFPAYNNFVKKIRKELGDRSIPPNLNCLAQLLPITKTASELNAWEAFSVSTPQKNPTTAKAVVASQQYLGMRIDKQPMYVQRHLMRLFHHTHYIDVPSPGIVGQPSPVLSTNVIHGHRDPVPDVFLASPAVESVSTEMYMAPYVAPPAESPSSVNVEPLPAVTTTTNVVIMEDDVRTTITNRIAPPLDNLPPDYTPHAQSILHQGLSTSSVPTPNIAGMMTSGPMGKSFPHQGVAFNNSIEKSHPSSMGMLSGFNASQTPSQFTPTSLHSQMHVQPGIANIIMQNQQQQQFQSQGMVTPDGRSTAVNMMLKSNASSATINTTITSSAFIPPAQPHAMSAQAQAQQHHMSSAIDSSNIQNRMFGAGTNSMGMSISSASSTTNSAVMSTGGMTDQAMSGLHHPNITSAMPSSNLSNVRIDQMGMPGTGTEMHSSMTQAGAAATGFLTETTSRSGSSTPTIAGTASDSPRTGARGGRRKNAGSTAAAAGGQQQPRAPKRKKEAKQQQQQVPIPGVQNPMMSAMVSGTPVINSGIAGVSGMQQMGGAALNMMSSMGTGPVAPSGPPLEMMNNSNNPASLQHMQQLSREGMVQPQTLQQQQMFASWQMQQQQQLLQRQKKQIPIHPQQHSQQHPQQQPQQLPQQSQPGGHGGMGLNRFPNDHLMMMNGNTNTGGMPPHQAGLMSVNSGMNAAGPGRPVMMGGAVHGGMYNQPPIQMTQSSSKKQNLQQKILQKINNQQQHQQQS